MMRVTQNSVDIGLATNNINKVVGILHPSRVISVLFGGRANHPSQ